MIGQYYQITDNTFGLRFFVIQEVFIVWKIFTPFKYDTIFLFAIRAAIFSEIQLLFYKFLRIFDF